MPDVLQADAINPVCGLATPACADGWLSLGQAARLVPGRPNRSTLFRWARRGVIVAGRRIVLASDRIAGRIKVKRSDLERFLAGCRGPPACRGVVVVEQRGGESSMPPAATAASRDGTRRYLEAVGLIETGGGARGATDPSLRGIGTGGAFSSPPGRRRFPLGAARRAGERHPRSPAAAVPFAVAKRKTTS
jgi:hypothetical protein